MNYATLERVGDWSIHAATGNDNTDDDVITHVVRGWGLRWYCESIEDAHKVAELLNRVTSLANDVSSEDRS